VRRSRCSSGAARAYGYGLVELLVAMSLGLLVCGAMLGLYRVQRSAYDQASERARMDEAGRAALDLIAAHLRMAGYPAGLFAAGAAPLAAPGALFACAAGRPTGDLAAARCEADARGSDGIQLRYADSGISSWAAAPGVSTDCLGQALPAGAWNSARFFARPSGSTGEPELYCEGGARMGAAQPVVEGVEMLRFSYWMNGRAAPVRDLSGVVLDHLQAVSLCVLVRGKPAARARAYLDCDGQRQPATDRRPRQTYRPVLALRNLTVRN
jgi:type IV pilus assembly protein PilW